MRMLSAALVLGIVGAASAQTSVNPSAATNSSPTAPAISTNDVDSKTSAAPVPGANSFTEAQAKDRIEKSGYTEVSGLRKDDQGIWRGQANKGGKSTTVALDYKGNVVAGTN